MRARTRLISYLAAIALAIAGSVFGLSPARAGGAFDGTFVHAANGLVEHFSLTETDGQVAGFIYSVSADASSPNGIKEVRINVSGATNGNQVNFRQGLGEFSTTLGWAARANGGGFNLQYQANGGYLSENQFVRSAPSAVNADIAALRQGVAFRMQAAQLEQNRAAVVTGLMNAQVALQGEKARRPGFLSQIDIAKSAYAKALNAVAAAQTDFARRQEDVATADATAQAAQDAAQTSDDRQHASDLRPAASDARQRLSDAHFEHETAELNARTADSNVRTWETNLVQLNAHIAQLTQSIANCKVYLAKH